MARILPANELSNPGVADIPVAIAVRQDKPAEREKCDQLVKQFFVIAERRYGTVHSMQATGQPTGACGQLRDKVIGLGLSPF
jgi:hypothetical protein